MLNSASVTDIRDTHSRHEARGESSDGDPRTSAFASYAEASVGTDPIWEPRAGAGNTARMNSNIETAEDDEAPSSSTAGHGNWTPKLIRWVVALLALQAAAIVGLGAALFVVSTSQTDRIVAVTEDTRAAVEEVQEAVKDLPTHDPQAELELGDLLCATRDGNVSYRPGLGGVFVHECRYREPDARRSSCEAYDIYGNTWSCNDR